MNNSRDIKLPRDESHPTDTANSLPDNNNTTSSSLLEQLVYIDNFMHTNSGSTGEPTPNLDIDGQLSLDLAAFADDSFIFPDEDKKPSSPYLSNSHGNNGNGDFSNHNLNDSGNHNGPIAPNVPNNNLNHDLDHDLMGNHIPGTSANNSNDDFHEPHNDFAEPPHANVNVSSLPKWPVPPGAKSSLESAGLSQNQIELLSALVAQHQQNLPPTQPARNSTRSPSIAASIDGGIDIGGNDYHGTNDAADSVASNLDENCNESELDKRRRNTAASARFRIKKKMKEKQMEDKIQNLNEVIKSFESKTQQLEMENKLLKNLIIEKGSQKSEYELRMLKERARQ